MAQGANYAKKETVKILAYSGASAQSKFVGNSPHQALPHDISSKKTGFAAFNVRYAGAAPNAVRAASPPATLGYTIANKEAA
ncbi:hypothetical protein D9M68_843280 [compost metagenome]